jgi:hypothetical protein
MKIISTPSANYLRFYLLLLLLFLIHLHTSSSSQAPTMQTDDAESSQQQQKMRVTLIGDSILDNKAYVNRTQPSVSQLLRKKAADLDLDWTVTLCASTLPSN